MNQLPRFSWDKLVNLRNMIISSFHPMLKTLFTFYVCHVSLLSLITFFYKTLFYRLYVNTNHNAFLYAVLFGK